MQNQKVPREMIKVSPDPGNFRPQKGNTGFHEHSMIGRSVETMTYLGEDRDNYGISASLQKSKICLQLRDLQACLFKMVNFRCDGYTMQEQL